MPAGTTSSAKVTDRGPAEATATSNGVRRGSGSRANRVSRSSATHRDSGQALHRSNVQEAFGGEGNPHQEGVRVTYSGDEAVELKVTSGRVALLPAAPVDGGRDGPLRWATGQLVLEDGTRLEFSVQDDASGGHVGTRGAGTIRAHHGGLSGIDVPSAS